MLKRCGLAPREIMICGPRAPLRHELVSVALADGLGDFRFRIVDVAEEARARRAGHHARGTPVALVERLVVDAVDAERALGHLLALHVDLANTVGTGPG